MKRYYAETASEHPDGAFVLAVDAERSAVERERAAFFTGWMARGYTRYPGGAIIQDQAARRYPLPKEG